MDSIIFDMDGVLINSEHFWHEAEIEVFSREGVVLTDEMCMKMAGVKCEDVMRHWIDTYDQLKGTAEYYAGEVEAIVRRKVLSEGEAMPGVVDVLKFLKQKGYKTAVASASKYSQIEDVLTKLRIGEYFNIIHSAQDEKEGKPAPDVFLHAAQKLQSRADQCLVIEDSANGVLAGKRAGMTVWAVPAQQDFLNERFSIADYKTGCLSVEDISKILGIK